MKKYTYTIIIVTLVTGILPPVALAQMICAGIAGTGDTFTDIQPDSVFLAAPVHLSPYPGGTVSIDMDHDGTYDFEIFENGGGGLGGGGGTARIDPLTPAARVMSHPDTSWGYPGVPEIAGVADTLEFGDTITFSSKMDHAVSCFWSYCYGMQPGPDISTWVDIGTHYVGVAVILPSDTLYGWIRVDLAKPGGIYTLTIMEYACNINKTIGIGGPAAEKTALVYPDPFGDRFTVRMPGCTSPADVTVRDLSGRIVLEKSLPALPAVISAAGLPRGLYFIVVKAGGNTSFSKAIKR